MSTIAFYDDVDVDKIPSNATHVAYYVDGHYANGSAMKARFPHAQMFGITVSGSLVDEAICCDCEPGDLTPSQAVTWVEGKLAKNAYRPIVYASQSTWDTGLTAAMAKYGNKIKRWVASYPGPGAVVPAGFDAHQYADSKSGISLDCDVSLDTFWEMSAPKPKPVLPEGVVHFEGTYDLKAKRWTVKKVAGTAKWDPKHKNTWAKALVQVNVHDGKMKIGRKNVVSAIWDRLVG